MTQNTSSRRSDETAAQRLTEAFTPDIIDALLKDAKASGTPVDGMNGLLNQMTKAVLERALQTEMTDHLGYESGSPDGQGTGNSRNGKPRKTVSTISGRSRSRCRGTGTVRSSRQSSANGPADWAISTR